MDGINITQRKATIEEFLQSGRLGELTLGMGYDEMVAYVGLPPGEEDDPDELYTVWSSHVRPGYTVNLRYGNLALFLLERKLVGITLASTLLSIVINRKHPYQVPRILYRSAICIVICT